MEFSLNQLGENVDDEVLAYLLNHFEFGVQNEENFLFSHDEKQCNVDGKILILNSMT